MTRRLQPSQRGVSLIEAVVALAVLAFGMLGVVGMQATLRLSADTAKQRSEAVRIAQEAIENGRAFSAVTSASGVAAYADVAATAASAVAGLATNTTYTLRRSVADDPDPRLKTLTVDITWDDRAGQQQAVRLATSITGIAPALAASLGVPADKGPTVQPRGRHRDVPPTAFDMGDGTSAFVPPQPVGGTVSWVFNNGTGFITSICSAPGVCVSGNAYLLSGFVRFATGPAQPTTAQAETPPSSAITVAVSVAQTAPSEATVLCYQQLTTSYVAYYCAMPVTDAMPRWSGRSSLSGLDIATSLADADAARYRVCRYTPVRDCQPAVDSIIWGAAGQTASCSGSAPTPSRRMSNADHPLDYANAAGALTNQNFLVIRAGDGITFFDCPADDTATPLLNGNTWRHQPAS